MRGLPLLKDAFTSPAAILCVGILLPFFIPLSLVSFVLWTAAAHILSFQNQALTVDLAFDYSLLVPLALGHYLDISFFTLILS